MNIVITDKLTIAEEDSFFEPLEKYGQVIKYDLSDKKDVPARIKDADIILCNKTLFTGEVLKNASHLKYIGLFATGYNNIDLEYTKQNGITVCNAGSYSTDAVAQQTFALILNHFSRISEYQKFVQEGGWKQSKIFSSFLYPMKELAHKKLGIVGYGSIGKRVAEIAKAFHMEVLVYTRSKQIDSTVEFVDFERLLKESDIISVHCPLNEASKYLFDSQAFSKMKAGSYFVNTARGAIIDEQALYHALTEGHLAGAGLDVLEVEPMSKDSVLMNAPGITITPHTAWTPMETRERLLNIVCENIEEFMKGKPQNVVNQ